MLRIALLFVFIFSFDVNVSAYGLYDFDCAERSCIAVVDAGSTGSRVHIYTFEQGDNRSPVNIQEVWTNKVTPGFASLSPEAVPAYLNQLFGHSPSQSMPIVFYATAGMRLLPTPKQTQLYHALEDWFAQQDQWKLQAAKTITGRDEGLYGWLAANYQNEALTNKNKSLSGVLDIGGASTQVALPVSDDAGIDPDDLIEFDIYGRHIKLFSRSFLGLGQVALSHQFLNFPECFAYGYELPSGQAGRGDANICGNKIAKLINGVHEVDTIVKPVVANNPVESWYALGAMPMVASEESFHFVDNQLTGQKILEESDSYFCRQQWSDLEAHYPGHEYIYGYCLFPSYYYALMVEGYGISPDTHINYFPSAKEVDWTVGVVLHQQYT